jgi:hypothetical protein
VGDGNPSFYRRGRCHLGAGLLAPNRCDPRR